MGKKHLTKQQVSELADMIKSGKTNAEVAQYFKISVATVNNHRTRMKRAGVVFPSKRGRKPKAMDELNVKGISKTVKLTSKFENYNFKVNGVLIRISGKAKDVFISNESMEINF